MAIASVASLWTEEFLEEVVTALDVSLGRVAAGDLDPTAAMYWEQAQQWLREVKQPTVKSPSGGGHIATTPPFPLTGEQLRSLQRAVDRATQARIARKAGSKAQRIVTKARKKDPVSVYSRLRQGLRRIKISSRALAALLVAICILNLVELYFFRDALYRPVFGVGAILSATAFLLWLRHHWLISDHSHYVEGVGAPIEVFD